MKLLEKIKDARTGKDFSALNSDMQFWVEQFNFKAPLMTVVSDVIYEATTDIENYQQCAIIDPENSEYYNGMPEWARELLTTWVETPEKLVAAVNRLEPIFYAELERLNIVTLDGASDISMEFREYLYV